MKTKFLIVCAFACTTLFFAQTKLELEAQNFFWGENDAYKTRMDIPEKWENESAVIIYKNENYDFHKFGKKVEYKSSVRRRIKLLDQAAVTEFSTFAFQKRFRSSKGLFQFKRAYAVIGVKIIKANGSETIIDIEKESLEVDGETKIALANLEVGDILDFFYYSVEPFKSVEAFGFEPVEETLGEAYPIMEYKLFFETENDFFINFNSFNGAPELTEIPTEKNSKRHYSLLANDIEKQTHERWFYPLVELPAYKFQVYFARSGKFEDRALAFLPEKEDIIKKTVSKEEVLDYYEKYKPRGDIKTIARFIKNTDFKSDRDRAIAVYYFARHQFLTQYVEGIIIGEADILSMPFYYINVEPAIFRNDRIFVSHFMEFLKDFDYDYDLIVGKKRYDGSLKDLLIQNNAQVVIKVNTNPPLYFEYFSIHSDANQFDNLLEGTNAYALSSTKKKLDKISTVKLPQTTYNDNESFKDITVNLVDDFSGFTYQAVNKYKGYEKQDAQFNKLIFKDYIDEDYKKYGTEPFVDQIRNKKMREKTTKELAALIEKLRTNQSKSLKESIEGELAIADVTDYDYTINETGRYGFDTYMSYNESFTATDALIKKAGPNYIFEVGKLIGGQVELSDKERKRTENIYMNYPRSYNYNVTLNIPEGYTVSGLDKLNKTVDNKTGAFISTAIMDDNTLRITTKKQYKNNFENNAEWPLMTAFLDEAFQFTNEKILLKKD